MQHLDVCLSRSKTKSAQSNQSSLCAQLEAKDLRFRQADNEDSDQTGAGDLSLCWVHRPFCWFCHAAAHF